MSIIYDNSFQLQNFEPLPGSRKVIQRRLARPLRKDDTQIREAFQIFRIPAQACLHACMRMPKEVCTHALEAWMHAACVHRQRNAN